MQTQFGKKGLLKQQILNKQNKKTHHVVRFFLDCVDYCNNCHHFRTGNEAVNSVLRLSAKILDGSCVELGNCLPTKIANGVGGNSQQRAPAKVLDAIAIESAQGATTKIRQPVATNIVLGLPRWVVLNFAVANFEQRLVGKIF